MVLGMSGSPGRPKVYINIDFLELLREAGYTWVQISQVFGTSRTTLWRRLKESSISISKYSNISDSALDYKLGITKKEMLYQINQSINNDQRVPHQYQHHFAEEEDT